MTLQNATMHVHPPTLPDHLVTLQSSDGARIAVSLFGGQLCSWQTSDDREHLFMSSRAHFDGVQAIRGGVPIIFPQFGAAGTGPRHGFARTLEWTLHASTNEHVDAENDHAILQLRLNDSAASKKMFDAEFALLLTIRFSGTRLSITLDVDNIGATTLPFCAALHTYLRTNVRSASIRGLQHCAYRDAVDDGRIKVDNDASLIIEREIDRLYFQSASTLELRSDTGIIALSQSGFTDTVVWNPWADKTKSLADCAPDDYLDFVCIEAAVANQTMHLPPGQRWRGTQSFQVLDMSTSAKGASL